jgi:hypothetical protein
MEQQPEFVFLFYVLSVTNYGGRQETGDGRKLRGGWEGKVLCRGISKGKLKGRGYRGI